MMVSFIGNGGSRHWIQEAQMEAADIGFRESTMEISEDAESKSQAALAPE
jgi:hypothetical protein